MPGNQPSTYGNTVFIWQNPDAIPYNQAPLNSQSVPTNTQYGSMNFGGLTVQTKSYIVGYAVGPNVANICSWVYIPMVGQPSETFQTSIAVPPNGIFPDFVQVTYNTPVGNAPQTNNQWVGIWQGIAPSYTVPPLGQVTVGNNNATGQVSIAVPLLRGTTYCLGYFMGQKQTTLAASYNFST
jgi:hypothetical protein